MKLKRPENNIYNIRNLLPIPFFLIMAVVTIDLGIRYLGGNEVSAGKVVIGVVLMLYVGARAWYGVRQAIDFTR